MENFESEVDGSINAKEVEKRTTGLYSGTSAESSTSDAQHEESRRAESISAVPSVPPGHPSMGQNQTKAAVPTLQQQESLSGPPIPTVQSYINSFSGSGSNGQMGSGLSSIGGNPLLQTQHLSVNPSHGGQRLGNLYGEPAFGNPTSSDSSSNGQNFSMGGSNSISQPQLLHLQHPPSSLSVGGGLMESTSSTGEQKMLLSQPGLIQSNGMRSGDSSEGNSRHGTYLSNTSLLPPTSSGGSAKATIPHPHINARPVGTNKWSGSSSAPKPWHNGEHANARENMNKKIIELLQQRRPNAGLDWHQKLPQMAKRLEEALYSDASSFEQYNDVQTLKGRLQQLALSMGSKSSAKSSSGQGGSASTAGATASADRGGSSSGQSQQPNSQTVGNTSNSSQSGSNAPALRMISANGPRQSTATAIYQSQSTTAPQGGNRSMYHMNQTASHLDRSQDRSQTRRVETSAAVTHSMQQQSSQQITTTRQFIKPNEINPILMQNVGNSTNGSSGPDNSSGGNHKSSEAAREAGAHKTSTRYPQPGGSQHSDEHRRQVLKQQQQRLLLLRHASKCPHVGDRCPVTPHCASMKQLWQHIMSCKDQDCKVAHCVSSRYVLSHYSKCKESECPVCGPVRDAIRKNFDRSREIINLSNSGSSNSASNIPMEDRERKETVNKKKSRANESSTAPAKQQTELDTVSCAIYSFTDQQIKSHIDHLHEGLSMKSSEVKELCLPLVEEILKHHNGYIFASPVDPIALGIPDYPTIVKRPMDLGTVRKRLESSYYRDVSECASDVRLCFENAMLYNPAHTEVYKCAKVFKNNFDRNLMQKTDARERELDTKRLIPEACALCGEVKLIFEPPNIYCNGKCNSQRIRRNSYYYTARNAYHWCVSCYNDLRDPIRLANDGVLMKSELEKKRHDAEVEESWVACSKCDRWVHQICGLFNGRRNTSEDMEFLCPHCILEQRKKHPERTIVPEKKTRAADLPRSVLSDFIENKVNECLEQCYTDQVEKYGVAIDKVEKAPSISVRQVSSIDQAHRVRDGMLERYKDKNYPSEFPCRTKCLLLFQNLDGQDVILFGMYVYEYGHKCPQPNQRRVYVSYLDSVHYFRPRSYRTAVYHEILISYLEYVKERGFHTAHIWACPPMKGDDYIFNCHPQDQKTPKDDRLRLWYVKMLEKCKIRGIVHEVVDFHTEYLADPSNDATCMPYFEGDYWVGEAENIIKNSKGSEDYESDSEPEETDKVRSKRKKKSKSKTKQVKKARVTRGTSSRPDRDIVMSKLSAIIEPMKEAFFVARLLPKEYADDCASRRTEELALESDGSNGANSAGEEDRQSLQEEALSSGDGDRSSSSAIATKGGLPKQPSCAAPEIESPEIATPAEEGKEDNNGVKSTEAEPIVSPGDKIGELPPENAGDDTTRTTERSEGGEAETKELHEDEKSGDPASKANESDINASSDKVNEPLKSERATKGIKSKVDDTEDRDDTQDSEHFESRLAFLNLCQGNNYQFDQLRRAKHTSLMTLYHLHNPDAPKFMAVCNKCSSSILSGYRYHCENCDIDFCQKCYQQQGHRGHPHPLRPVSVGGAAVQLTEEQRRERQRSIALHLQLLQHASTCSAAACKSKNCQKMKEFLKHGLSCKIKEKGCPVCKRVFNLLNLHARSCRVEGCTVPDCNRIKEHMRKNAIRQQQMDDRRRQMMNEMYRGGASTNSSEG